MAAVSENSFLKTTDIVLKNLEGGYYHPNMLRDGRLSPSNAAILAGSGETMFGLDRVNGAQLASSPYWRTFWGLIDAAGAAKPLAQGGWKWNAKGGSLEPRLRALAGQIMYPWFNFLTSKYLSAKAMQALAKSPGLQLHLGYAAWNGEGWFKRFAAVINAAVQAGTIDPKKLTDIGVNQRVNSTNSLIRQSGAKIALLVKTLPGAATAGILALIPFFFGF